MRPGLEGSVREVYVLLTFVPRLRAVQVPQHRNVGTAVCGTPFVHEELGQEEKPGCVWVRLHEYERKRKKRKKSRRRQTTFSPQR